MSGFFPPFFLCPLPPIHTEADRYEAATNSNESIGFAPKKKVQLSSDLEKESLWSLIWSFLLDFASSTGSLVDCSVEVSPPGSPALAPIKGRGDAGG